MTEYREARHVMSKTELEIARRCLVRAKLSWDKPTYTVGISYPELRCLPMTAKDLPHAEAMPDGHPYAYKFSVVKVAYGPDDPVMPPASPVFDAIVCGDLIMQMGLAR